MCVCLRMLAESWSILSQFIWHQDEVPQYYSEQLTFSVQPSVATVSLSTKTLGSSPAHFSWPRAVGRHLMQNYFACRQIWWTFSRMSEVEPAQGLLFVFLTFPRRPSSTPSCFMVRLWGGKPVSVFFALLQRTQFYSMTVRLNKSVGISSLSLPKQYSS